MSAKTFRTFREITGEDVRARRLELGLTQEALARMTGISRRTIVHCENGRKMSDMSLFRIASALKLPHGRMGNKFKARRLWLEMSLDQLAAICRVSRASVSRVECGVRTNNAIRERMMAVLGMD